MNDIINTELLQTKDYLSVKDMMKTFHIHENTVYIWIQTQGLPKPIKFRQKNYWKSEDISTWFQHRFFKNGETLTD